MKPAKGASKVFIFIIIILFRSENQSRVPRTLAENRYTMGIVPLCTPIPFALSRSFHSVPPIIRDQAASNYFIGASAAFPINAQGSIPSVFGRPSTCTALSSAKYRLLLSPLDFPRLNGKFNRARRRFSRRSPGHRKQPSVILFYRVFNKDRD